MTTSQLRRLLPHIAIGSLLILVYFIVGTWVVFPGNMPVAFAWHGSDLTIYQVLDPERVPDEVAIEDVVVAVEGQPTTRYKVAFPLPLQESYTFTLRRGDAEQFDIVIDDLYFAPDLTAPATVVSLLTWAIGVLLLFSRDRTGADWQPIAVGLIFIFSALVLMGVDAASYGIPGAALFPSLLGLNAAILPMLGLVPRDGKLTKMNRRWLQGLLLLAVLYALVGFYEQMFLFPTGRSIRQAAEGFYDWGTIGFAAIAFALASAGGLLLLRAWRSRSSFERKRLQILLLFVAVGVGPLLVLTVIPGLLFRFRILPLMFGLGFLLFIPAGYFFVFNHSGYLRLDLWFSRLISLILLALVLYAIFATSAALVYGERFVAENTPLAGLLLALFAVATLLQPLVARQVNNIIFSRSRLDEGQIGDFAALLTRQPTFNTLHQVVSAALDALNVPAGVLLLQSPAGLVPAVAINIPPDQLPTPNTHPDQTTEPFAGLLSGRRGKALTWSELELPLSFAGNQTGLLALSAPLPSRHFDSQQAASLARLSDMLAIAVQAIRELEERSRDQAASYLLNGELERRRLSSAIHDEPLQTLNVATNTLERYLGEREVPELCQTAEQLRAVRHRLREICSGLHPAVLDQGMDMICRGVVAHFQQQYAGIVVNLQLGEGVELNLPEVQASALYHVLTEALNNVAKHARASKVDVQLNASDGRLVLLVSDDGVGVGVGPRPPVSDLVEGHQLGQVNMHAWARIARGELLIMNGAASGTMVRLLLPAMEEVTARASA